jgi:hypothetical protein
MRDVEDFPGVSNLESNTGSFSNEKVMQDTVIDRIPN